MFPMINTREDTNIHKKGMRMGMYISGRERKILEMLLSTDRDTTFQDLAEVLDVSIRTIQRDIKGTEAILRDSGILLQRKTGNGLRAVGPAGVRTKLLKELTKAAPTDYTTEERHVFLMARLLQSDGPIKQNALANELKVSLATIGNDLDKIENQLKHHDLKVVKKRGYGIELRGSETAKRKMMSNIIHRYTDEVELLSLFGNKEAGQREKVIVNERLLGLVDKGKLSAVERIVMHFIRKNNNPIADSAYIGLIVHLALAIERVAEGNRVVSAAPQMKNLRASKEFETASAIMEELEQVFDIQFPPEERTHIAMHLTGAKALKEKEMEPEEDPSLWLSAQKLIALTGNRLGIDFARKDSLYKGLVTHLKPAIYRMEERMNIQNPLLSSIKKEYSELFDIVSDTVAEVFPHLYIPDDEIGFLAMHFASALLQKEERGSLSALVVCTSGIGTSKILTATIQKEFPEVKYIRNASAFEVDSLQPEDFDLILSTVHLDLKDRPYLIVNPFLTDHDIEEIHATIQTLAIKENMPKEPYAEPGPAYGDFLTDVRRIAGYSDAIGSILEHFSVTYVANDIDKEELIRFIASSLAKKKLIADAQEVAADLVLRESKGGTGLPDTGLALLHTRSHAVKYPLFSIFRLKVPLPTAGMDGSVVPMQTALVMLLPADPKDGAAEVMSHISTMIIESGESKKIIEYSNENDIYTFLARGLKQLLGEITTI